jgi:quinol monooxygenase YgiN
LGEFVTIRRWRLREEREEAELVRLVREEIEPHHRALSGDVRLGLLRIDGTRSYFAVQYWRSRGHWEAATQSASYAQWWAQYEPMLARWDQVMEFEAEFESQELLS